MKCVKKNDVIQRVTDVRAKELVTQGWKLCSKQEWKDKNKPAEPVKEAVPVEKPKKRRSRNCRNEDKPHRNLKFAHR